MRRRRKLSRFQKLLLLVLLAAGGWWFWSGTSTTNPEEALARARSLLERGEFEEARLLLAIASQDESIRHWATLTSAELLEKQAQLEKAYHEYASIDQQSAASLDARVGLLRLQEYGPDIRIGPVLAALERDIQRAGRSDLRGEFLYLKARGAEKNGELDLAFSLYHQVRKKFPNTPRAKDARSAQEQLRRANEERFGTMSIAALLEDAQLLLKENDPLLALEKVQLVKSKTAEKSSARLETMLVEEKILRKLKRHEEADHLLLLISADGEAGTADEAMLKIAKNAWNIDDHHRGLEFLDNLQQRFPKSRLIDESMYIEARILEEIRQGAEAKSLYSKLASSAEDRFLRIKARRRLAWLYYRAGNTVHAAETFQRARESAAKFRRELEQTAPDADSEETEMLQTDLRKLDEEWQHCTYWRAAALLRVAEQKDSSKNDDGARLALENAKQLKQELIEDDSSSYYSMLAKKLQLGGKPSETFPAASSPASAGPNAPSCLLPIPAALQQRLAALKSVNLNALSQHEIDWYYSKQGLPGDKSPPTSLVELRLFASQAAAYLKFSFPKEGIELAQALSDKLDLVDDAELQAACSSILHEISYPQPYVEYFAAAAKKHRIPISLLLAVSRTESHFDPRAQSTAGALGLMQLLPSTAKQEGHNESRDLFDPELNISLGAQHLARLLTHYEREKAYASAAYNAGAAPVNRWLSRYPKLEPAVWTELIGYPETKRYVKKVLAANDVYRQMLSRETSAREPERRASAR